MAAGAIISGAIAGVTAGIQLFLNRKRGQQKLTASAIADETERLMQQNLEAWQSSNKTAADRAQALANFDALWNKFVYDMSTLGKPGAQGITDRAREPQLGDNLPGIDWFKLYRDPIENEPGSKMPSEGGSIPIMPLALIGIGIAFASLYE